MDEYNILRKKRNRKSGFATTAILISLAVILLLVALFVFLLGKVNKKNDSDNVAKDNDSAEVVKEEKQCDDKGECTTIVNCNSKERIFNNNLRDIKDAAVSYFTNERLPKNIGEKIVLSLAKMQEEKLVLNVIDSNDKTCDTSKTYVEVTKEKNEYVMKINLSCSDMEDYIIIHLGCYDYCKDTICEKQDEKGVKEFEYEYKKVTSCIMSDWSEWGEWKTTREKTSDYKKEDTKVVTTTKTYTDIVDATKSATTYNCDKYGSDYKLEGTKCVKRTSTKEVIDATSSDYSYNCDKYSGYKLNGTVCEKVITKTETIDAIKNDETYYCDNGYKLNGKKCEKVVTITETKDALANPITYTCPSGYTKDGSKCYRMVTKTDTKDATITCAKGYSLSNGKCVKTYEEKETINATKTSGAYTCPDGYTKDGKKCYRMVTKTDTKEATITCAKGYSLSNGKCVKTYEKKETINATKDLLTYTCPSGYKKDDITYTVKKGDTLSSIAKTYNISVDAIKQVNKITTLTVGKKLRLPAKYQTVCYKMVTKTDTKDATITCPSGYTKNGTKCSKTTYKNESFNATPNYKTVTYTYESTCRVAKPTTKLVYDCDNNGCGMVPQTSYEYVWEKCQKEGTQQVISSYSCPSGYSLSGTICYRNVPVTENIDATITCPSGYTKSGTKCSKKYQEKETIKATQNPVTYTCPSGYNKDGTKCYRMVTKTDIKDVIKTCASGYTLSNNKCTKTYEEKETINATQNPDTYTCTDGYTKDGTKCYRMVTKTDIKDVIKTCASGYTLSNNKCTKTYYEKETINATENPATYSCELGYSLSNGKCTKSYQKTESTNAKVNPATYYCKSGYTLSGTKCIKTITSVDTKDATKVTGGYVCKSGYTLNGTKCEKTITTKDTKDATQNKVTYTCNKGYKLEGTKCTKVVTEEVKTTYYRYATRTCTGGSTDIKWSSSNNDKTLLDEGYKLTGNKREVEILEK